MLDLLTLICWIAVYVLILCNYIFYPAEHSVSIPLLAVSMNIAWECNVMIANGWMWGHVAWFFLDAGIFVFGLVKVWQKLILNKICLGIYIVLSILLYQIFFDIFKIENGMLISSFTINLLMSLFFVIAFKKISTHFKTVIAAIKLVGTFASTIDYGMDFTPILIIGGAVFFVDLLYLSLSMEESLKLGKKRR